MSQWAKIAHAEKTAKFVVEYVRLPYHFRVQFQLLKRLVQAGMMY
jgi:hypothetical protein